MPMGRSKFLLSVTNKVQLAKKNETQRQSQCKIQAKKPAVSSPASGKSRTNTGRTTAQLKCKRAPL